MILSGTLLPAFNPGNWPTLGIGTLLHLLLAVSVTLHTLREPREPRSSLFWIYLAWAIPFLGSLAYLAFGVNRLPVKGWQKQHSDETFLEARRDREAASHPLAYWRGLQKALYTKPEHHADAALNRILNRLHPGHPLLGGNEVAIHTDGPEAYPAMLAAIDSARHHIHLQSYIIDNDAIGRLFLERLAARARAGVTVRLLYDDFGSSKARFTGLFHRYRRTPNLRIVGFSQVNPIKRQFQLNLRNHRKLLIVDGALGFTGGMNLRGVHGIDPGDPEVVRDYHFTLHGPIVLELQYTFLRDWYYMTDEDADTLLSQAHFPQIEAAGKSAIRIVNAGPTSEREALCDVNFAMIEQAESQILLGTPYFVPPDDMRRALRVAALRGVDVRLLLPVRTNYTSTTYAARACYEEMLTAGVGIHLRRPPFMHSKFLMIDSRTTMIGTANFDNRSLKLNYETNLIVFDEAFANRFKARILGDFALADKLSLSTWRRRSRSQRLIENLFNLASPAL